MIYVPDEPQINRLAVGEIKENDFTKTPRGGYLLSGLGGVLALFMLGLSPFMMMGYDMTMDEKDRIWKLKRHGRVVWDSKHGAAKPAQCPPKPPALGPRWDWEN